MRIALRQAICTRLFIAAILFAKTLGRWAFRSMALCALLLGVLAVAAAQKTERLGEGAALAVGIIFGLTRPGNLLHNY